MARSLGAGARDDDHSSPDEHIADVVPLGRAAPVGPIPGPAHRPPAFWSSFVGRRAEIDEVAALFESARLVTLTGPGGMGKTRLGAQVADRLAPGRTFFVDLAPLREPGLVGEAIASAFELGELRDRSLTDILAAELAGGALLVLDNCEHLIGACAALAQGLLGGCRGLQILATSQQRLGVGGEVVWRVPPLALPEPQPEVPGEAAWQSAAVRLFCERAVAVNRSFAPSLANLMTIIDICRRLDGNPLAIELAAARADVLSPDEIAARLEDRFDLPAGGSAHPERGRAEADVGTDRPAGPLRLLRQPGHKPGNGRQGRPGHVPAGGRLDPERSIDGRRRDGPGRALCVLRRIRREQPGQGRPRHVSAGGRGQSGRRRCSFRGVPWSTVLGGHGPRRPVRVLHHPWHVVPDQDRPDHVRERRLHPLASVRRQRWAGVGGGR